MHDPAAWTIGLPAALGVFVLCYLIGSIPFGLILTRLAGLGDIRKIGSGNIGATNVLRTGHKGVAAATLALDAAKGAAGALAGGMIAPEAALIGAVAAVAGHMFPVWLGFRGGKGVATGWGALTALAWPSGLLAVVVWLLSAVLFRISSLAALITTAVAPFHVWYFVDGPTAIAVAIICILIWIRHRQNIGRLLRREEPKVGRKG